MRFKDSGIEWLGEIPEHWEVKKIKYIYKSINGFTPDTSNASYYDNFNGYDWITISDINKKYVNKSEVKVSQKYIDKFRPQITPKGSLLYSFKLSVGLVAFAEKDIYTNEAILSFLKTNDVDLNFLYYSSFLIQFNAKENIYGAKLLNKELINNAFIVLPPLQEQKAIAEFLDKKCDKISQFIESKQKLITLLQEKKQALINECVTKGLNQSHEVPTTKSVVGGLGVQGDKGSDFAIQAPLSPCKDEAQYKPSGLEYLGEIPKHWEVVRLGLAYKIIGSGTTPQSDNKEYYENGEFIWVNSGDLNDHYLYDSKSKVTQKAIESYTALKIFPKDSLVVAMYGATIGKVSILGVNACVNQACCVLCESAYFDSLFVFYWFIGARQEIISMAYGGGQPNISQDIIKNLKIPLPPLEEQKAIASYLDTQITKIDLAIEKTKQQITYIKEYKTSLINQAICGRIALKD